MRTDEVLAGTDPVPGASIPDAMEGTIDSDNDDVPNYLDLDSDNGTQRPELVDLDGDGEPMPIRWTLILLKLRRFCP